MKNHLLITCPEPKASQLTQQLHTLGFNVTAWPSLMIEPPNDWRQAKHALMEIAPNDLLFFVSRHAIRHLAARFDLSSLTHHRCFAIGETTANALYQEGFQKVIYPKQQADSEHLLALPECQDVSQQAAWIFRGQSGRELLEHTLAKRGATVTCVTSYWRQNQTTFPKTLYRSYDLIVCTSLDGLKALCAAWHHPSIKIQNSPITITSDTMLDWAKQSGFSRYYRLPSPTNTAIVQWCQDHIKPPT